MALKENFPGSAFEDVGLEHDDQADSGDLTWLFAEEEGEIR
ncbi:hypothetical protein [Desulfolithobacter dissulfuricans]|nr:hypothetical protein [Desulfolithobacter dissulfuricans]